MYMRWNVHIYGPNSEVYWECALVNFWMLVSDSWKGLPVWLTSCPISVPALPKTGTSYKTTVFFIFLLMFVSSLIFRPISDFLVSGKWGEIEAGLVSLCLNLLLIDTLLRDLKRVQTYNYSVLRTKQKNLSVCFHTENVSNVFRFLLGQKKKRNENNKQSVKQVIFCLVLFKNVIFLKKEEINENVSRFEWVVCLSFSVNTIDLCCTAQPQSQLNHCLSKKLLVVASCYFYILSVCKSETPILMT